MADQLNMNGLSINDGQQGGQQRSYIPPHMRGRQNAGPAPGPAAGGPPPGADLDPTPAGAAAAANGGMNNGNWSG